MLPAWAIGSLIGAGLGALKGKANEKKMEEQDKFRRAAIQNSPWTGMSDPGALNLPGMTGSLMSGAALGGLTGGMMGTAAPAVTGAEGATAGIAGGASAPWMSQFAPGAAGNAAGAGAAGTGMSDIMKWQLLSSLQNQG